MAAIFDGLKVIDCASYIAAPGAATVLADFGADVIKIEPVAGDIYRKLAGTDGQPDAGENFAWLMANRSRRGLALNLATPEGAEVLHRLVAGADVFITNAPFPARRRLGIDYETLGALNERLVYASFSAYGETGPEADKPGFDSNAWWSRSGLMDQVRAESALPPARSVPGMGDNPSAIALYGAIVTALFRRERTGKGGLASTFLLSNGLWSNSYLAQARLCGAEIPRRLPREQAPNPLMNHYETRDGRWLLVSLLNPEVQWPVFISRIGLGALAQDPRFADVAARNRHNAELIGLIDEAVRQKTLAEWRALLDGHGLTFGFVATLDDMMTDEQMRASGALVPLAGEELLTVNSPVFVGDDPKQAPRRAPAVGEHSAQVLAELGYDAGTIADLKARGILAGPDA
ncbi:CaiB/BaiF CoA transferase family protein [Phreatobacter sp.]|uniref:CaiB/BaiF CoA transferase family protein n=1 Tax=Phreatobacter sp. TaxID=1966341 RepID=UPI003F6E8B55